MQPRLSIPVLGIYGFGMGVVLSSLLLLAPYVEALTLPYPLRAYLIREAWVYLIPLLLGCGLALTILWARQSWPQDNLLVKVAFAAAIVANSVAASLGMGFFTVPPGTGVGPNLESLYAFFLVVLCLLVVVPVALYCLIQKRSPAFSALLLVLGLTPLLVYSLIVEYAAAYIGFGFK
jgi:hypothetical protein